MNDWIVSESNTGTEGLFKFSEISTALYDSLELFYFYKIPCKERGQLSASNRASTRAQVGTRGPGVPPTPPLAAPAWLAGIGSSAAVHPPR